MQMAYRFLATVAIDEIPLAEALVTYYVCSYVACIIGHLQKCSSYTGLLILSNNIPTDIDECILGLSIPKRVFI